MDIRKFLTTAGLCLAISGLAQTALAYNETAINVNQSNSDNVPEGFTKQRILAHTALKNATSVNVAYDGRIFVTDGSGKIIIFNDENDSSPFTNTMFNSRGYWDYVWSLALDPDFENNEFLYVMVTDKIADGSLPENRWGENEGSHVVFKVPVSGRDINWGAREELYRRGCVGDYLGHHGTDIETRRELVNENGQEVWKDMVYFTIGEGSTDTYIDWGDTVSQEGYKGIPNTKGKGCKDGSTDQPGAWRSQDAYHLGGYPHGNIYGGFDPLGEPTRPNGSLLRITTNGDIPADNPWAGGRSDDDAIVAYGLRNPFKLAIDPDHTRPRVYVGDVGDHRSEEINRVFDPADDYVENFGWPCYEGAWEHPGYDGSPLSNNICSHFYTTDDNYRSNPNADQSKTPHTRPYFSYLHPGWSDSRPDGSGADLAAVTAIEVYAGTNFPAEYHGGVFFGDHENEYLGVMKVNQQTGEPDPNNVEQFLWLTTGNSANNGRQDHKKIVDLHVDPAGNLYVLGYDGQNSRLYKIRYTLGQPAEANLNILPTKAAQPGTTFTFDASGSVGDGISYAWDLDGDNAFDDGSSAIVTRTINDLGAHPISLKVTDEQQRSDVISTLVFVHNEPLPTVQITSPSESSFRWHALTPFTVTGTATEPDGSPIAAENLTWQSSIYHCELAPNENDCHAHPVDADVATTTFTTTPIEHEMPSRMDVIFTAKSDSEWAFNWWNDDWTARQAIFVQNDNGFSLNNHKLKVALNSDNFDYGLAGNQGVSLRFVDSNNNPLQFKIDNWNNNGNSTVWVNVPFVPSSSHSTYLWMYYGNNSANSGSSNISSGNINEDIAYIDFKETKIGLEGSAFAVFEPEYYDFTLTTNIDNISGFTLAGSQIDLPYQREVIVNNPLILQAPGISNANGLVYTFLNWSDGRQSTDYESLRMPANDFVLTGNYEEASCPGTEHQTMHISGNFNGWTATPMQANSSCVWEVTVELSGAGYKFRPNDDSDASMAWDGNFGDTNLDGFVDPNGENIPVPGVGEYVVWFNDVTGEHGSREADLCNEYAEMYFSGTANGWIATPMTLNTESCRWETTQTFDGQGDANGSDRFKFRPSATLWDVSFGDPDGNGNADQGVHPHDTFVTTPGTYLITFDDVTGDYSMIQQSTAPTASISASATSVRVGDTVTFDASGSTDPNGTVDSFAWSNGDTGSTTSETYNSAGSFDMSVTVTDNDGETDTTQVSISVAANEAPVAIIDSTHGTTVALGTTVDFTDASTDDDGIASRAWSGILVSQNDNISFTFNELGIFEVTLTVVDTDGVETSTTREITVNNDFDKNYDAIYIAGDINDWAPGNASELFSLTGHHIWRLETSLVDGDRFKFTVGTWALSFGDNDANGVADSDGGGNIVFNGAAGTYAITFNDDTLVYDIEPVDLGPVPPLANINASATEVRIDTTVTLDGSSSSDSNGSIVGYLWSTGETTSSIDVTSSVAGTFEYDLTVTDNEGAIDTDTVSITFTPNAAPTANAGDDQSVRVGSTVELSGSASTDSDGNIASFEWTSTAGNQSGEVASYTLNSVGTYNFTLTVTDNDGATSEDTVQVVVTENTAPIADAGPDQTVTEGDLILLTGSASTDSDGTIVNYAWTSSEGNRVGEQVTYDMNTVGTFVFTLEVTDNEGATATDTVSVVVEEFINQAPVANAGSDAETIVGNTVAINGRDSTDIDGTVESYDWICSNGETNNTPSFAWSTEVPGTYTWTLVVTDNLGATSESDTVTITVNSNPPPVADAGADFTAEVGVAINFDGSATTDPNNDTASYTWTNDTFDFPLEGVTPGYIFDAAGEYVVTLRVIDQASNVDTDTVTVTVIENFESNENAIFLAGAVNGWAAGSAAYEFQLTGDNTWTLVTEMPASSAFKFTTGSWAKSFGDVDGNGVADTQGGGNITSPAATATYLITFNDQTLAYSLVEQAVEQPPVAQATATPANIRFGEQATLSATSSTDADGTIVSYSWTSQFGTESTAEFTQTFPSAGAFEFELTVTDNDGLTSQDVVTVVVVANTSPSAIAGGDFSVRTGEEFTLSGASSSDADGEIASYQWESVFDTQNGQDASYLIVTPGDYDFILTVTDNDGATSSDTVTVSVLPNAAPVADAGADQTVRIGSTVSLSGSASSDSDGTIASYEWTSTEGNQSGVDASYTLGSEGVYEFTLTVTDNDGESSSDSVTVNVVPNSAPVADAGPDQTVRVGEEFTLDGGNSSDSDGTIANYQWSSSQGTIVGQASVSYTIEDAGEYTFTLSVEDNDGATDADTVTVTITPNSAPVADAGNDEIIYLNNSTTLSATASSDSDGSIDSYEWSADTGETASGVAPSWTPSAAGIVVWTLTVTDNDGATDTDTVVYDVRENPAPVADAGDDVTVPAGSTVQFDASGSSDASGDIVSYEWTSAAFSTSLFGTAPSFTFNVAGTYTVELSVGDTGNNYGTDTVTVIVLDDFESNQDELFMAGSHNGWNPGDPAYELQLVADNVWRTEVELTAGGQFKFTTGSWSPSFGDNDLNGTADTQGGGNIPAPGTGSYIVTFNDDTLVYSLVENTGPVAPSAAINGPSAPVKVGTAVTLTSASTDSDGNIVSENWSDTTGAQANGANFGRTYQTPGEYDVTLTVFDNDGLSDSATITIVVVENQAPIADAGTDKTVTTGQVVVLSANGSTDSDGIIVSYEWDNSVQESSQSVGPFDVPGTYTYTVTVTDDDGASASDSVTITVEEAPEGVEVSFTCNNGTVPNGGTSIYVVGNQPELGNWTVDGSTQRLNQGNTYPTWTGTLTLAANTNIQWKCVKVNNSTLQITQWEGGGNNSVATGDAGSTASTTGSF